MIDKINDIINKVGSFFNKFFAEDTKVVKKESGEKQEYIIPLNEEALKRLPEITMKEIQSLRAYATSLENKVRELTEELDRLKRQELSEDLRDLYKISKSIQRLNAFRYFALPIKPLHRTIRILSYDGKPIMLKLPDNNLDYSDELVGIVLEQLDHYPWLYVYAVTRTKYDKKIVKIPIGSIYELPNMIFELERMVDYLKWGELRLNYTYAGDRVPYYIRFEGKRYVKRTDEDLYVEYYFKDIQPILDQYPKLKELFVNFVKEREELSARIAQLESENREYKMKLQQYKALITAYRKSLDTHSIETLKAIAELGENQKVIADLTSANINMAMRLHSAEQIAMSSVDKIDELSAKIIEEKTKQPEETGEVIADKVIEKLKGTIPSDVLDYVMREGSSQQKPQPKEGGEET